MSLWRSNSTPLVPIYSVALAVETDFLATGSSDQSIKIFDLKNMKQIALLQKAHQGSSDSFRNNLKSVLSSDTIWTLEFSPQAKYLISAGVDKAINIYRMNFRKTRTHLNPI